MTTTRAPRVCLLLLAGLLATGCGAAVPSSAPPTRPSGTSSPALTPPPGGVATPATEPAPSAPSVRAPALEGELTCLGSDLRFDAAALSGPAAAEAGPSSAAAGLRQFLAVQPADAPAYPRSGWWQVRDVPDEATFLARAGDEWLQVTLVRSAAGDWEPWDRGGCNLTIALPEGVGFAEWRLDPAAPPAADATTVRVLATELACASGRPPGDRVLAPIVLETDAAVTIAVAVRQRPGGQDCPGNPEVALEIELQAPLGTRRLFDGSSVPAIDRGP